MVVETLLLILLNKVNLEPGGFFWFYGNAK